MHALLAFAAFTLCLITTSFSDEAKAKPPAKLERIQDNYHAAVSRAVSPLTKAYLSELQKLKTEFTKAGDLESAIAVDNEIKAVMAAGAKGATPPGKPVGKTAEAPVKYTKEQLISFVSGKTWGAAGRGSYYTFHADGTAESMSNGKKFTGQKWHVRSDGVIVVEAGAYPTFFYLESARKGGRRFMKEDAELADIQLLEP